MLGSHNKSNYDKVKYQARRVPTINDFSHLYIDKYTEDKAQQHKLADARRREDYSELIRIHGGKDEGRAVRQNKD